mgnify:CR=1 FL=1
MEASGFRGLHCGEIESRMKSIRTAILSLLLAASGCATMGGSHEHYYVCDYDTAWEAAVESAKGYSITSQNSASGTIETAWIEMEGSERGFGIFGRAGFGNRERARLTITVKRLNDVTAISVMEHRQRWHARGGATSQATKWWPVDPSEETLQNVSTRLNSKLLEKGCEAS